MVKANFGRYSRSRISFIIIFINFFATPLWGNSFNDTCVVGTSDFFVYLFSAGILIGFITGGLSILIGLVTGNKSRERIGWLLATIGFVSFFILNSKCDAGF